MKEEESPVRTPVSRQGRVLLDASTGVIRSWFDPEARPLVTGPFAPRELARELLRQTAPLLGWQTPLADLVDGAVLEVGGGLSARFTQRFRGVPVLGSEVVVNMHADGRVHSLYNQYHYDIAATLNTADARISPLAALAIADRLSHAYPRRDFGPARLVVVRHRPVDSEPPGRPRRPKSARARFLRAVRAHLARARRRGAAPVPGRHYLAWQITLRASRPLNAWLLLVDAVSGALIEARDMVSYASGRGQIFDPNPVVASGDLFLSSDTPASTLDALRVSVKLERLKSADGRGRLHLDGAWVHMDDSVLPTYPEPTSRSGRFVFSSTSRKFLDVMAYYHVDRFQQYIQYDLGLTGVADFSIPVDPQGENGADTSQATGAAIVFGEGGVPDASDAMVIVHEYGHALQHALNPDSNFNDFACGETEGMSDFLAAAYFDEKHKPVNPPTRGIMFSWNFNPTDFPDRARRYNLAAPGSATDWAPGDGYALASLWSSATFELYRKLGGDAADPAVKQSARDLAIRLHLVAHSQIPGKDATVTQAAQEIEAADTALAPWRPVNGLHVKVIYDTFARRKVPGFDPKPVDVYVDDGRHGGYGSADGNDDSFQNVLWLADQRSTQDIWTRLAPYPVGAARSPQDHQQPKANQAAFVYVQVGNRGTMGSGPINVRAFAAAAGSNLVWPTGWTELAPPATQPTPVTAGGGVVAGPFSWTPAQAGKAPILAVVECATDKAVTELLQPGDLVPIMDLVPFDNNIAMRDIQVTA